MSGISRTISNATPHILLLRLFEEYDETIANAVKENDKLS